MILLSWLIHSLLVLLSVAFFTLFERNVIGLFHSRLGPNKVSFVGLFQPLLDAIKLLTKYSFYPLQSNNFSYNFSPFLGLLLGLFIWTTLPSLYLTFSINYSLIIFFCLGSILVFSVLLAGWSSNSKYSLIGSLRSVSQSISYESVFSTLLVLFSLIVCSFSIRSFMSQSSLFYLLFFLVWVICTLAETHRAPFDFSESESELVSGFNTEYSGVYFAFIFLSEYSVLLYSCFLISFIFFSFILPPFLLAYVFSTLFLSFVFIWIRVTFCRFRYDILMSVSWNVLLPWVLLAFLCFSFLLLLV